MKKNSLDLPVYKILDFCKSSIFVLNLEGFVLPKELSELEAFDVKRPHVSDYYLFYFIKEGDFTIVVDFEKVIINGPAIFFIRPRQVKSLVSEKNVVGWSLTIEPILIETRLKDILETGILSQTPLYVHSTMAQYLNSCMEILHTLLNTSIKEDSLNIKKNLAASFIGLIVEEYIKKNPINKLPADNRRVVITQRFYSLLREEYRKERKPSYYAKIMNISLSYLNECVKNTTGKPISYWISEEIILEAKRLLFYTKQSAKEIAHKLGYDDHTHFYKIFIKITGMPPGVYRKKIALSHKLT